MAELVAITLNGERRNVPPGSVGDLIRSLARDPRTVAVERNGEILSRDRYDATLLTAGDRLEIVHFVQGG